MTPLIMKFFETDREIVFHTFPEVVYLFNSLTLDLQSVMCPLIFMLKVSYHHRLIRTNSFKLYESGAWDLSNADNNKIYKNQTLEAIWGLHSSLLTIDIIC